MQNTLHKITLFGRDISEYKIIAPSDSYPSETTAARELQKYIRFTSGVELALFTDEEPEGEHEIIVGKTNREAAFTIDREKIGNDGYFIFNSNGKLVIAGGVRRGTMYGVYDFLEKYLGWRFYVPEIERTLAKGDIVIPEDISEEKKPILEYREIDWVFARDPRWAVKAKINGTYRKFGEELGGELAWGGDDHNMGDFFDNINSRHEQPCLSDPEKVDKAIERIGKYLEEHPDLEIFVISQNDNQDYCTCERCAAIDEEEGNHAGTLIRFINKVSDTFREKYPKLKIQTFAYQYTRTPPKKTKPRDNVIIKLCPMECCYHHPLYDKTCQQNVDFASDLLAWKEVAQEIYIWEYSTNFAYFLAPFPNLEVQRLNMKWYVDNKIRGIYPEGNYISKSGEFAELRGYLQARLMWDPYMSKEQYYAYMDDFLDAYYGPGWENIRKFIDWTTEEAAKRHCDLWSHPNLVIPLDTWRENCEEIGSWWDAAEQAAADMPLQLSNVKRSRLQFTMIEQTVMWEKRFRDGGKLSKHLYRRKNMEFYNTLVLEGISWREAYGFPPKVNFEAPPLAWCDAHTYALSYEDEITDD